MPSDGEYTIADLARLAGLNVRTIRYWIAQGLIPASGESGPGAHYGQGHLDRLTLIKRLQTEYLPNAEIRRRLAPLSDSDVASLVASEEPAVDPLRPTTTALEYVRGLLEEPASGAPPPPARSAPGIRPRLTAAFRGQASQKPRPIRAYAGADSASADVVEASEVTPTAGVSTRSDGNREAGALDVVASLAEVPINARSPSYARMGIESSAPMPPQPAGRIASERSQWERLSLGENIELHIRRPLSRPEQRRVERLITIARQVLDDDTA